VALSFLYLEFLRMLQLLRLGRDDRADVAIEVVMLRHEVSVLGRQVERPSLLTGSPWASKQLGPIQRVGGARHRELVQAI
jgi:hypothetical protein